MSNLTPRGTIKGVIRSGGGGGVTDYDQLTGRPQINSNLLTGDKGGHDLGLMNLNDIRITKIVDLTYGTNYDLEFPDDHVYITNQVFQPAGVSSNGTKGLVPRPSAGDTGKILSNEGWITPSSYTPPNYSTTEQKTGQKWIDGKDIYFITYTINGISGTPSDWETLATKNDIDSFIDGKAIFYNSNNGISFGAPYAAISYNHGSGAVRYYIDQMGSGATGNLTAIIYYTKS